MTSRLRALARALVLHLPPKLQCRFATFRSSGRLRIGTGSFVHQSVQLLGMSSIRIGSNSVLSEGNWLNVNQRHEDPPAIDIGDHCFIGRRNFFSSGRKIAFGHYVLTANDCHFLGSSHVVSDPLQPCISTGTTDTNEIVVGHNTFFGAGARVLGNVHIGHGCVVGACALVTRDVPPFSQVAGFPAVIRRRYSFPRQAWVSLADFTSEDEAALPGADAYLAQLRMCPAPRMPYLAAGADMGNC